MADPLADHEHNTLTTLKLYERAQGPRRGCERVVYASAGCTVAEKTFDGRRGDAGGRAGLAVPRQPVPDLEDHRRVLLQLLLPAPRAADRQGALPERLRPRRGARRRPLARDRQHGLAQRHADVHLQGAQARGAAGRERRHRQPRLHLRRRHGAGPDRLRDARRARRRLQPRERRRDDDPRAGRADQRADRQPDADRARAGARLGPLRPALRRSGEVAPRARLRGDDRRCATGSSARSPGRGRTSTGSRAAWRGTRSGWRPPERR